MIDALDAAGRDLVLIETVGTGQTDIDVAEVADVRIVVTAPGLGDDIQAMKSGFLEIADILVVNKGDREGAQHTVQHLQGALSLKADARAKVPVLKVTATTGEGIRRAGRGHRRGRAGTRRATRAPAAAAGRAISSPAPPPTWWPSASARARGRPSTRSPTRCWPAPLLPAEAAAQAGRRVRPALPSV